VWRVLACFGFSSAIFAGLLFFSASWYKRFMFNKNLDQLFQQMLANGDPEAAYKRAHPQFQGLYPLAAYEEFVRHNPSVFIRDKLTVTDVQWLNGSGGLYVVLTAHVAGDRGAKEVSYYGLAADSRTFRLVGISPGLDAALPLDLKPWGS
jgi:hypothetical protein